MVNKNIVIGAIGGIVFLAAGIIFFIYDFKNIAYFLIGSGILVVFLPFVISSIILGKIEREKENMFLEFTRNLVESVESGTPISKSIINMKQKNYGSLSRHVEKLANQIGLGIPLQQALEIFAYDTKNKVIIRAITLIREADKTGGNINTILESVASSVSEIAKLKAERRSAISAVVVEGYIIFLIFIIIMIVMEVQIIPMTAGITGISGGVSEGLPTTFGETSAEETTNFDPAQYSFAFLALLVTQGLFAGLVIGKLAEGEVKSGIKHSFIMVSMAVLISTGSKFFL